MRHDQVTQFLSKQDYTSKELWEEVKKDVRAIENDDGVLIIDDTIQEKPHSKESALICWHYEHNVNRNVKGINLLNCVYHASGVSLPVAYELIKKTIHFCDIKTKKGKRQSEITKNEQMRDRLKVSRQNQLNWRYCLADSWFYSSKNRQFIHKKMEKHVMFAMKTNRLVALSEEDKKQNRYTRIDSLDWSEKPVQGGRSKAWISPFFFTVKSLQTRMIVQVYFI